MWILVQNRLSLEFPTEHLVPSKDDYRKFVPLEPTLVASQLSL